MNNNNNFTAKNEAQCCINYCEKTMHISGQEMVNSYPCNQRKFTTVDLWEVQKNRKQYVRRSAL